MALLERIQGDIAMATQAGDAQRLGVLQEIKARLEQIPSINLAQSVEQQLLTAFANEREAAARRLLHRGRNEESARLQSELTILEEYRLRPATDDEMDAAVNVAYTEIAATGLQPKESTITAGAQAKLAGKRLNNDVLSDKVRAKMQWR